MGASAQRVAPLVPRGKPALDKTRKQLPQRTCQTPHPGLFHYLCARCCAKRRAAVAVAVLPLVPATGHWRSCARARSPRVFPARVHPGSRAATQPNIRTDTSAAKAASTPTAASATVAPSNAAVATPSAAPPTAAVHAPPTVAVVVATDDAEAHDVDVDVGVGVDEGEVGADSIALPTSLASLQGDRDRDPGTEPAPARSVPAM